VRQSPISRGYFAEIILFNRGAQQRSRGDGRNVGLLQGRVQVEALPDPRRWLFWEWTKNPADAAAEIHGTSSCPVRRRSPLRGYSHTAFIAESHRLWGMGLCPGTMNLHQALSITEHV
jgi:hypothetical protein